MPKGARRETEIKEVKIIEEWLYNYEAKDWQNAKGQNLTGYSATEELIHLLTNNINSELE